MTEFREQTPPSPTMDGYMHIAASRWAANRLFMRAEGFEGMRRTSPTRSNNGFLMEERARKLLNDRYQTLEVMPGETYEEKMGLYIKTGIESGSIPPKEAEILTRHLEGNINQDPNKQTLEEKEFIRKLDLKAQSLESY